MKLFENLFNLVILASVGVLCTTCGRVGLNTVKHDGLASNNVFDVRHEKENEIFHFNSNLLETKDGEVTRPLHFTISLPKELVTYRINGSTDFYFLYSKNQLIYIKVHPGYNEEKESTIKQVRAQAADSLVECYSLTDRNMANPFKVLSNNRIHFIVSAKNAQIFLMNIEKKRTREFIDNAKSIMFE